MSTSRTESFFFVVIENRPFLANGFYLRLHENYFISVYLYYYFCLCVVVFLYFQYPFKLPYQHIFYLLWKTFWNTLKTDIQKLWEQAREDGRWILKTWDRHNNDYNKNNEQMYMNNTDPIKIKYITQLPNKSKSIRHTAK